MDALFHWVSLIFTGIVTVGLVREDMRFIIGPRVRAEATVMGHQSRIDEGTRSYSATLGFTDDQSRPQIVHDTFYALTRTPDVGARRWVVYPRRRPDKARIPRPLLRLTIYAALGYLIAVLVFA